MLNQTIEGVPIETPDEPLTPTPGCDSPEHVHPQLGKPKHTFPYTDGCGKIVMVICRFEGEKDRKKTKEMRPRSKFMWGVSPVWEWRAIPENRPLYNLHKLASAPYASVIFVEGEKAADAMAKLYPDAVVTTSAFGSNAASKTSFSPLKGRDVIIVPDNDKPGRKHAKKVALLALKAGARTVKIMNTEAFGCTTPNPDGTVNFKAKDKCKNGWDAGDAVDEGWTADHFESFWDEHGSQVLNSFYPKNWHFIADGSEIKHVTWKAENKQKVEVITSVFDRLEIVGRITDAESAGHGVLVRFRDEFGTEHELLIAMSDLHGPKINEVIAKLAAIGWKTYRGNIINELRAFLQFHPVDDHIKSVSKTGWQPDGSFATPCWSEGTGSEVYFDCSKDEEKLFQSAGALKDWKQNVGNYGATQSSIAFGISLAFVGPLLQLLNREGFGIHIWGPSSGGKSTSMYAHSSVWGPPSHQVKTWNLTTTALEATTALSNHTALCLDEIGQSTPDAAFEAGYAIANGTGKGRGTVTGGIRERAKWLVPFLSNGEIPFAQYAKSKTGAQAMAGQKTRIVDVPADAGNGFGVFDSVPNEYENAAQFADSIKAKAGVHHGVAGREFVQKLIDGSDSAIAEIKAHAKAFMDTIAHILEGADGQVTRVAGHFSIISAAGEFALSKGVVDWPAGTAQSACEAVFKRWVEQRGGLGSDEDTQALKAVDDFISRFGTSRFLDINAPAGERSPAAQGLAGHRYFDDDDCNVFLIFRSVFTDEICAGKDSKRVCQILHENGQLVRDGSGKNTCQRRLPSMGRQRVYVVRPKQAYEADFNTPSVPPVSPLSHP